MISFKDIVESGLLKADTYQKKRGVVLSNYIALILCAALLLLFVLRLFILHNINKETLINFPVGMALFLVTVFLNRLFLTTVSRLYLSLLPVAFLWYMAIYGTKILPSDKATDYDSLRIFFLAMSCIPYLLLDKQKWRIFILGLLPTFVSIFFFDIILKLAGIEPAQRVIDANDFDFLQVRTVICYFFISACCFTFQVIIANNDDFNQRLVFELKERKEEIEVQNEELLQGQENLSQINLHLENLVEERTQKIRTQNEILLNYAYTNAHHVRGPVARLLGLIQLSRMKTDLDYPWFFEKVEHETREIDIIIKRIGSELEPGT